MLCYLVYPLPLKTKWRRPCWLAACVYHVTCICLAASLHWPGALVPASSTSSTTNTRPALCRTHTAPGFTRPGIDNCPAQYIEMKCLCFSLLSSNSRTRANCMPGGGRKLACPSALWYAHMLQHPSCVTLLCWVGRSRTTSRKTTDVNKLNVPSIKQSATATTTTEPQEASNLGSWCSCNHLGPQSLTQKSSGLV